MQSIEAFIETTAGTLLHSKPLARLRNVSFLGVLEPHFRELFGWKPRSLNVERNVSSSGSRYDHSLAVARIFLKLAQRLELAPETQRLAVAWSLVHDVATWPLSHTSEAAFERVCNESTTDLREKMIKGDKSLPAELWLARYVQSMGVQIDDLLELLSRTPPKNGTSEIALLWQIVRSPLTPDTLDGMFRCSSVYQVAVPLPEDVIAHIVSSDDFFDLVKLGSASTATVRSFWSAKARIYRFFINSSDAIRWESAWSKAIQIQFVGKSIHETLCLPEEYILGRAEDAAHEFFATDSVVDKYKPPLRYRLASHRSLDNLSLVKLSAALTKTPIPTTGAIRRESRRPGKVPTGFQACL